MTKQFFNAKDIADLVGVSESKSYSLIRIMNDELEQQGFLTVRGKIPAAYANKRFGLENYEVREENVRQ